MKTLHSLELKNGVLFKDATLRLDHVGLTTIRGMNLDAKKSSSASNGSGKSHLLSFLPELLFDSTPLTKEIKSRTKKDRLVENSTSTLLMSSGDSQYKIIKKGSKKGFDIDIEENGKDIGLRTKSYTKDKIEYLFNNITEDEFYTLWYIDSRRPSDLQFGSPAKRMEFFTRLFRLESFDSVRKLFNTMAAEAKQNKTVYMKLKEELEKFKLDIVDDSEYKIKLKKLMRRQEKITEEIELLIKQNQKSETLSKLYPDFAELKSLSKELGVDFSLKQVTFAVKQFSLFLERAEKIKKQRTLYEDYLSRLKKYNSAMSKTKNIPYTLKDLRLASEKKKELTKLKSEYLNIKNASVSINENKLFKLRDSVSIKDLNKVKESRDKIRAEVLNLKESIDTLKDVSCNHGESFTCPTCYQKVEASEKIIASLEKSLKEKQSIFKKYDEKYRLILELQTLENDYEAFTKNRGHPRN